jgi:hypothetical protein
MSPKVPCQRKNERNLTQKMCLKVKRIWKIIYSSEDFFLISFHLKLDKEKDYKDEKEKRYKKYASKDFKKDKEK